MSQPWSRPAGRRAVTLAAPVLLVLKQDWLSKGDKDRTLSAAALRAHSMLVACLINSMS